MTTKGGLIAWIKLDPRMITEIHRRAAKAALKDFRTATFVPKLACDRKGKIDELLMGYKKSNPDFRYLVRNDSRDLKVLIKRISKGNFVPYRKISLDVLGRLSPLKTKIPERESGGEPDMESGEEQEMDPNKFQRQGRRRNPSFIPKDTIYRNITAILNGFELKEKHDAQ